MRYVELGKSGLKVARICFGTWQFGGGWGALEELFPPGAAAGDRYADMSAVEL